MPASTVRAVVSMLLRHVTAQNDEDERRVGLLLLGKGAVSARWFDWPRVAGLDDEEERRAGSLLLGKAAVLAHRFERPLAAEMDDDEQSGCRAPRDRDPELR